MASIPIGIQLYTVRDMLKADFKGTMEALASMGFKGVEFAWNYGGMTPEELAAYLKGIGLKACGLHTSVEEIANAQSQSYAYARALGCRYVTTSCAGAVAKDWLPTVAKLAEAGAVAARAGFVFTYHNHAQEFQKFDGEYALDILYAQTTPATVQAELDTFWIKKGGEDPVAYIRKYRGRVPQVHLKDMNPADQSFTEIGTGCMDLPAIFAAAAFVGAEWVIYEQDTCKGPSIESARTSIGNLKAAGLAG